MNLKSIELQNFQKHTSLHLDFTTGINVIVGPSHAGKSCVRRAIEWVLFNNSIDGIRKEGSKKTSVKIELDDGTIVERTRSASINRYTLIKNGEEKVFDSIGKTFPQEIVDAIGIHPITIEGEDIWLNSAHQIALPFLFDKSPSWRMKLFNKLTGNDLLDKLFSQFNKDLLRISRDHKTNTERLETLTQDLTTKEIEKEQLEAIHLAVKKQLDGLKEKQAKHDNYLNLLTLRQTNKTNAEQVNVQKIKIKFPEDTEIKELTVKVDNLEQKKTLLNALLSHDKMSASIRAKLQAIVLPALNAEEMATKIDHLAEIKAVILRIKESNSKKTDISQKIDKIAIDLKDLNDNMDSVLENVQECPTCGQAITNECKEGLKA